MMTLYDLTKNITNKYVGELNNIKTRERMLNEIYDMFIIHYIHGIIPVINELDYEYYIDFKIDERQ